MEFMTVLVLAAGAGLWPPAAPIPPDAATLELRILAIEKGTPKQQVERRLGLIGCVPNIVFGTTISHTLTYAVGQTHVLYLHYARGKSDWDFYNAELEVVHPDWEATGWEWLRSWPKAINP